MTPTDMPAIPAQACDTHMHVYGPADRYPPLPNAAFPPVANATAADYRAVQQATGLQRVVVVQPSCYGTDNRCTLDAVGALGEGARAIATVGPETTDAELARLTAAGVRGDRFFMYPGGALGWDVLPTMAARVAPLGWHVQLQLEGHELADRLPVLERLPCPLVVDHIGRFDPAATGTDHPSFRALLRLLAGGNCWVKLSAPYIVSRQGAPDFADVAPFVAALIEAAPERMVWASNWPHPGFKGLPDERALLELLWRWVGDRALFERILVANPARLYGYA